MERHQQRELERREAVGSEHADGAAAAAKEPEPVVIDFDAYDAVTCWLANAHPAIPAASDELLLLQSDVQQQLNVQYSAPSRVTSHRQLESMLAGVREACQAVNKRRESALQRHAKWVRARNEAVDSVCARLLERINLEDQSAAEGLAARTSSKRYTRVNSVLRTLVSRPDPDMLGLPDDEVPAMSEERVKAAVDPCEIVLGQWFTKLRRAFKEACATGTAAEAIVEDDIMNNFQYWRLMRECGVPAKTCQTAFVQRVYTRKCAQKREAWRTIAGAESDKEDAPASRSADDIGLHFDDFVEVVVRLAHSRYRVLPRVCDRIERMMTERLFPPRRDAPKREGDEFRSEISSPACEAMFERHAEFLSQVFHAYSDGGGRDVASTSDLGMTLKDFTQFVTDAALVKRGVIAHRVVKDVFLCVQVDESAEAEQHELTLQLELEQAARQGRAVSPEQLPKSFGGNDLMVHFEFLEAVAALACYAYKSPYMPLESKIDAFISSDLGRCETVDKRRQLYLRFNSKRQKQ